MCDNIKWIEVNHKECGKPAVLCKDKDYYYGERPTAEDFKHLNGELCFTGEFSVCDSCGKRITYILEDNRPIAINIYE